MRQISGVNRVHNPGFLIAIEGIDGAGKTTQAHLVQAALQARKLSVVRSKEPTTAHWGQILRDSALTGRLSLDEEIEAFIKDRKEHVETTIAPALSEGQIVIVDRYYFSNMAYQGARGHDPMDIMRRNEEFSPEPDLLVILDIDPKLSLQRIRMRGDRANHFERTGSLKKAREIFLAIDKPYRYVLDGAKGAAELRDLIVRQFTCIFANRVASSPAGLREKFDAALRLLGADPV
jgi:dTMP kinase